MRRLNYNYFFYKKNIISKYIMPQKLIRLTCSTGDGVFNGLFNEDIHIKENSEIALQSLSVERKSQRISITESNNNINFSSVNATEGNPASTNQAGSIIPAQLYDKTNSVELLGNISNAANKVCNMTSTPAQMNIQWKCGLNNDGHVEISAGVSPFYTLDAASPAAFPDFAIPNRSVENNIIGAEAVQSGVGDGAAGIFRESDTAVTPVNPAESYLFGSEPFIKSTGALRVRLKRLLANGGQESAYIGLVKGEAGLTKLRDSTLTEDDMEYAIRINGHNNAMDYKTSPGGTFTPTVTPINHTVAGAVYNDVIEIVIQDGTFVGQIHQNDAVGGAGTDIKTTLDSADVVDGEDYYWFISFVEGKDKVVLDLCNVSLDPFFTKVGTRTSLRPDNTSITPVIEASSLSTLVDYDLNTPLTANWRFVPLATTDSSVANFLGWPRAEISPVIHEPKKTVIDYNNGPRAYQLTLGFSFTAPEPYDNGYNADNYLIDTQSFVLDSYDSYGLGVNERTADSGGSRRNILATIPTSEIPVPGTSNGIIQYQPNTLYYIAIKNRSDIITRQLRFRLITGRYQDVKTQNMAAMTLLIRDVDGYKNSE
jgi:hypothetical protein